MASDDMRIVLATLLYFAVVFGTGLVLGPARVLWLEPRVGPAIAELIEAPFLVIAMVGAARWVPKIARTTENLRSSAFIGVGALVLLLMADFTVGYSLRGLALPEQLARFATAPGVIYAILLLLFALMPVLLKRGTT
jgi:hypothetical protein